MGKPTVAVIGASSDRSKYGNKAVRAHQAAGFVVFPVNLRERTIEGLKVYRSVAEIPGAVDRVLLYLPPAEGIRLLRAIAGKKPKEFFVNPGAESETLIRKATQLGLNPIQACSIVAVGKSPSEFPG